MTEPREIRPAKVKELPPKFEYEPLVKELSAAHAAVGELRGFLGAIPNPDLLIAPFRKKEAVASSAIEGTRATLVDVLEFEAQDESRLRSEKEELSRKVQDIREIQNYERAMGVAMKLLKTRPIGENLLKQTHSVLLDSVRGESKNRGNFRREQVRVGDYIPPVHTDLAPLMHNWEKYLNANKETDVLVKIGIAHYQFEAIHPFLDGNGRIGRLVIPLFLCQENVLPTPVLFISDYFEEHKVEYQRLLHGVDISQDWIPWLRFFLIAVEVQARRTTAMAKEIQDLYERMKGEVIGNIRSQHAIAVLDLIFTLPYIRAANVREVIKAKSKGTTYGLLDKFVKEKILDEYKNVVGGKESIYIFSALTKILRV